MMFGLDLLGLPKFTDEAIKGFPSGFALGVFATTFGDARDPVKRLLATGKVSLLRMQLIWDDNHQYTDSDIPEVKKLSKQYEKIQKEYGIPVQISPFCEHRLTNPDKYLDIVKQEAPSCSPVNSIAGGLVSKRYINEIHGTKAGALSGRYNFSFDGNSCVNADTMKHRDIHRSAQVFFLWTSQFNGKKRDDERSLISERTAYPSEELIRSVAFLGSRKGRARLRDKDLWKSHSEDFEPDIPRELKPVFITPTEAPFIELRTKDALISRYNYSGRYLDGRPKYYVKEWGYKLAEKAQRISKSPTVEIWANGEKLGFVNPGFREGVFK